MTFMLYFLWFRSDEIIYLFYVANHSFRLYNQICQKYLMIVIDIEWYWSEYSFTLFIIVHTFLANFIYFFIQFILIIYYLIINVIKRWWKTSCRNQLLVIIVWKNNNKYFSCSIFKFSSDSSVMACCWEYIAEIKFKISHFKTISHFIDN